MYKERPWQVGEVELEMHVDRVLGLDRGVFACDYHGSSAGKLWHEIGIYHQFIMCLGITHNRYLYTGRPNVYILNWNRLVRGFALICHYTLAFCVLSLLMLAQYPSDDKQCASLTRRVATPITSASLVCTPTVSGQTVYTGRTFDTAPSAR